MSRNWTPQQQDAINSRNGSVLVSAAAGSGKTAVLVERVIQRLSDTNNRSSADRLLIVTFTRAAASEMKERIAEAIEQKIKENPEDANLVNQQMLLPLAKICTIDSFCNSLVRENFQLLDIPADFKNADDGELKIIEKLAMDETLATMYEEGDENFLNLVELLLKGRDDSYLASVISDLYRSSRSFPFPNKWLEDLVIPFEKERNVFTSRFGEIIIDYVKFGLFYCMDLANEILGKLEPEANYFEAGELEVFQEIYYESMNLVVSLVQNIYDEIENEDWDDVRVAISNFDFPRRKRFPRNFSGEVQKKEFDGIRDKIKDVFTKQLAPLFCSSADEYRQDMEFFTPLVKKLVQCCKLYGENFVKMKLEKKLVDFSDITQLALKLLVEQAEDDYYETELAYKLSQDFDEILIDEYQDTNKAQDMIFTAISNDNLFRVGDVKQSIYKFRQAMPEIFIELKQDYPLYEKEEDEYPAKIILDKNFRSASRITENINSIFEQIMSEKVGDIEYNEEEKLNFGIEYEYKKEYEDFEHSNFNLVLCDLNEAKEIDMSKDEYEATIVAQKIIEMVEKKVQINDGGKYRDVNYGDFCIMMRSVNGGRGALYADKFKNVGISTFVEFSSEFFTSSEISMILSLLRVIDNPKQDVPLLALMYSPIFGFTVDEIASIKIAQRKGSFYSAVMNFANGESEELEKSLLKVMSESSYQQLKAKVESFLEKLSAWRSLSVCLSTSELIRSLYEQTSLLCIADAMDKSGVKQMNLQLFLQYASNYESLGYIGLSGYIRFIDRLSETKSDLASCLGFAQSSETVKIMSIHKSKGLEFPVCFLVNCCGKFNAMDERKNVIISLKHGIGLLRRNFDTYEQLNTVSHTALKLSQRLENLSEEMRILYVALTRAKEYMFVVHSSKNLDADFMKAYSQAGDVEREMSPYFISTATKYSDWLLPALMRSKCPQFENFISDKFGLLISYVIPCDDLGLLKGYIAQPKGEYIGKMIGNMLNKAQPEQEVSQQKFEQMKKLFSFEYKYKALENLTSKRAASEQSTLLVDQEYFASARPSFMNEKGLSGAQKGIATHKFVQYADFEKGAQDTAKEIERLLDQGFILEHEAKGIDQKAAQTFFNSKLVERINNSEKVYREKQFTVEVPISEAVEGMEEFSNEKIMIQGIADCAFVEDGELVIVDYKTDRVSDEEILKQKYKAQVDIYANALAICTGMKVKQTLLYSFHLNREIEVFSSKK